MDLYRIFMSEREKAGIYLHIPFCKSRCVYCDFVSSLCNPAHQQKYVDYLCRQIRLAAREYADSYIVDTLYFGGGTPSVLDNGQLAALGKEISRSFNCDIREFTVECNPGDIDDAKLQVLKDMGATRISLGVQSFDDALLKTLGRRHSAKDAIAAAKLAIKRELDVSVDCMIGLPGQTLQDAQLFADTADSLGIEHVSVYMLSVEDGTALKKMIDEGALTAKSDDEQADFYEFAYRAFCEKGFERYEVSNFCKNGKYALHNLGYWRRKDYIGLGVAAHSLTLGQRWCNPDGFDEFYAGVDSGRLKKSDLQILSEKDVREETVMLAMRLKNGLDCAEYYRKFGVKFEDEYDAAIAKNASYLDLKDGRAAIKDDYLAVMNSIVADFLK